MRGRARLAIGAVITVLVLGAAQPRTATAQGTLRETPALISADEITYDENLAVVTASGNVEISQGNRLLVADTVTYNQRTDVVTASGNVSLVEPAGEIVFADFAELTGDLRDGFVRDIRVLLTDRSRLAAVSGLRSGGRRTLFRKGVFSPCALCRDDPTRAPLWQIKAVEIEHDQEEKVIKYRDAWMEIFGVPVIYTPYFEHPDPTVERKSGFLAPTVGASEILGATYQQPYYWAIATDKDLTFAPIFTAKQGIVATTEYRQLLPYGTLDLRGSATIADRESASGEIKPDRLRGHIDSTARFEFDDTWRGGADIQRATDDTYLRIYNFSDDRTLTSRAFAEGLRGRNYASADSYLFQGLRATDSQSESPIILPMLDYNHVSEPNPWGAHYTFDGSLLALTRTDGRDSRRISAGGGWELPFTSAWGDVYNLTARVQADGYWVDGVDPNSNEANPSGPTVNDVIGRVFPQLAVNWRYPWVRSDGNVHQVLQPMAQAILAPRGSNPGEIPNEDSLDFEFDDTNLFSLNRFPGLDRVDPGSRFDYGLKWTVAGGWIGDTSAFLGQSYRLDESAVFADGSGVEENLSDVVGRVQISPIPELDLTYRARFDKNNFTPRRNEIDFRAGPPALNLNLNYTFIDSKIGADEFGDREELTWSLRSRLTRYWSAYGGQILDLEANDPRQAHVGVVYQDECFQISGVAQRNFFSDREIAPEDVFYVTIVFKYLGGLTSGAITGLPGDQN